MGGYQSLTCSFIVQVLATSTGKTTSKKQGNSENDDPATTERNERLYYAEDDEGMIAVPDGEQMQGSNSALGTNFKREKHLRYRTRVFAAESVVLILF